MLPASSLQKALGTIPLTSAHDPWSRAVGFHYFLGPGGALATPPQPLFGGAPKIKGARFTPRGSFDSIYLADTVVTAFTEVSALVLLPSGPSQIRFAPWVMVAIDGILTHILDLTDAKTLAALGTTELEITGNWVMSRNPPTQALGQAAYDAHRINAIRYNSAKHPGGVNLVVFPDRIMASPGNYLEVHDPHRNLAQRIGA